MQGVGKKIVSFMVALALCVAMTPCVLPISAFAAESNDGAKSYTLQASTGELTLEVDGTTAIFIVDEDVRFAGSYAMFNPGNTAFLNALKSEEVIDQNATSFDGIETLIIKGDGTYDMTQEMSRDVWPDLKKLDASSGNVYIPCNNDTGKAAYSGVPSVVYGLLNSLDSVMLPQNAKVDLKYLESDDSGTIDLRSWDFETLIGNFGTRTDIKEVYFPASLKNLGDPETGFSTTTSLFRQCTSLTSVIFAQGTELEYMQEKAFQNCSSLATIEMPEAIDYTGDAVFSGCSKLTELTLPKKIGEIAEEGSDNTFGILGGCSALKEVTLPYDATYPQLTFRNCTNLSNVTATCAPSENAKSESLVSALEYAGLSDRVTVTNQLHNLTYNNLTSLSGSGVCELCGKTLSSEVTSLDEGSEQYKALAEAADGRAVLAAAGVNSNVVDYTFQNYKDASFLWYVTTGLDSYQKADVRLLLLNADGTVTEKDVNSLNAGEALCSSSEIPAAYMVISAEVPAQQVTVTFDSKGGSTVDSQTVGAGGTISQPTDPTRDGYTFAGWFTDEGCTQPFDFNTPVSGDTTLYADWDPVTTPVDPGDDDTGSPNDPSDDQNDNADNRQNAGTDDTNTNKSTTNTNAKKATSTSPKTGDTAAAAGAGLAGLAALAALGGTLAYRRRKED